MGHLACTNVQRGRGVDVKIPVGHNIIFDVMLRIGCTFGQEIFATSKVQTISGPVRSDSKEVFQNSALPT